MDDERSSGAELRSSPPPGSSLAELVESRAEGVSRSLADIVEKSDDAIISQHLNGQITSWNQAAERMYGYPAADAIGQSIRLIIPAGRKHEEGRCRVSHSQRRACPPFETVRQHKSGVSIQVAMTVSPIKNREGQVVDASTSARDIGARSR